MQQTKDSQFNNDEIDVLDPINETVETITIEELEKFRNIEPLPQNRVSFETLVGIAGKLNKGTATLAPRPVMDLTARRPYDEVAGLMDFYEPGRWDCKYNTVMMSGIKIGPSPGQWDGTVGYIQFKAPKAGTYLIVVHFTGFQITMKLSGPWGTAIGTTATASDPGTVSALWTAKAGDFVFPSVTCVWPNGANLQAVQVYLLT